MANLDTQKLSRLLSTYVHELEKLEVVLAGLDAAGLVTVKPKKLAAAQALAKQHILALETDAFGAKEETRLIRHLEDARMPSFDFESSFENPKGPAVESFSTCSKAWEALNNFVFAEEGPSDE
jgi:hypothetical protein